MKPSQILKALKDSYQERKRVKPRFSKFVFNLASGLTVGLIVGAVVLAFNNPSANPPTGGGALGVGSSAPANSIYVASSTGYVGIRTTSPGAPLHIVSSQAGKTTLGSSNQVILENTYGSIDERLEIGMGYRGTGTNQPVTIGHIVTSSASFTKGNFYIATRDVTTDTAPTERLYINSSGNVGIGTTNPGGKLEVLRATDVKVLYADGKWNGSLPWITGESGLTVRNKFANLADSNWGGNIASINAAGGAPNDALGTYCGGYAFGDLTDIRSTIACKKTSATGSNYGLEFGSFWGDFVFRSFLSGAGGSELVRITQAGNVGIATTTPGEKLEVNGNVKAAAFLYSSDYSLKKNIQPLSNQLGKVLGLQGVSFDWKADDKNDIGFIAQEVEKIFPEVVYANKETGLKSIDYAKLTVFLAEAVKEQQAEIKALEKRIQLLEK